ncbi:P-loop containing nucleoside triphosphate hydrolase protein [Rhizoctonia solani]|nr:P-loop containing nucleoside triphosphate hydrolase protein [Rhizoctonia solani]
MLLGRYFEVEEDSHRNSGTSGPHGRLLGHWQFLHIQHVRLLRATTKHGYFRKCKLKSNIPTLIILCGLVGSGKSTFATALQREFPEFRRCNQDELGRREDVEREVCAALAQGLSVCVDRTNFDPGQRRTWIDIARQYPEVEIWGVTMDTPYETCHARLIERKDHPTLRTPEKAVEVLSRFSSQFIPINSNEGFNRYIASLHSRIQTIRVTSWKTF